MVSLSEDEEYKWVVTKYKIDKDFALVKINVPGSVALTPAKWGVAKEVSLGYLVFSVGLTLGWPIYSNGLCFF